MTTSTKITNSLPILRTMICSFEPCQLQQQSYDQLEWVSF
jgi:hypothetical protein